jgi:hypothetical protein
MPRLAEPLNERSAQLSVSINKPIRPSMLLLIAIPPIHAIAAHQVCHLTALARYYTRPFKEDGA